MTPAATFFKLILLLLAGSAAAVTLEQSIKLDKDLGKLYLIAPELFRGSNFAFAIINDPIDSVQKEVNVTLNIVGRNSSNDLKCTFKLKADSNAKIGLNSLRRLSEKKLLLVGYEEPQDGDRHAMTISFDLQSCESTHFFSSSIMPEIDQIITSSSSDEFTVFLPSLVYSNSSLSCPSIRRRAVLGGRYQHYECFDVDLRWSGMNIGPRSYGDDRFVVRGFDTNGTYKVLDFNTIGHSRDRPELISLPDATDQSQIVSSGEALCYLMKPGEDKWVHCLVFVENHDTFVKIVPFDVAVNIVAVSYSSFPERELLLVTEKATCNGTDCEDVVVTSISKADGSTKTYALKLKCGGRNRVAIGAERTRSKGAITVKYVCDYDDVLFFHTVDVSSLLGVNDG